MFDRRAIQIVIKARNNVRRQVAETRRPPETSPGAGENTPVRLDRSCGRSRPPLVLLGQGSYAHEFQPPSLLEVVDAVLVAVVIGVAFYFIIQSFPSVSIVGP